MDLLEKEVDTSSIYRVEPKRWWNFCISRPPFISRTKDSKQMKYFFAASKFGKYLAAFMGDELCCLCFYDTEDDLNSIKEKLFNKFDVYYHCGKEVKPESLEIPDKLKLFMRCTEFEYLVYTELLKVEKGHTVSYEELARRIGRPNSVRPVANALAHNLIGYIVPCHRVIHKNGDLGNYEWGPEKKLAMLKYEGVKFE